MSRNEIRRPQRQQVNKQIKERLDPGQLVDFGGEANISARMYGDDLPQVPLAHISVLPWRGYWYIKQQDPDHVPSPDTISEFLSVNVDDPTNSFSNFIYKISDRGLFFYQFVPDSDEDDNAFQYVNLGISTTFVAATSGRIPLRVRTIRGDRFAVYQDGVLVSDGYASNGGSVTVDIHIRRNEKTTVGLYYYSERSVSGSILERSIESLTPLADYAASYEDPRPDAPQNPYVVALLEGNRVNWNTSPATSQYVAGTQVFTKREDEEGFRLAGNTEGTSVTFLHDKDIYEHFDAGVLSHLPDTVRVGEYDLPYLSIMTSGLEYFVPGLSIAICNGIDNYAYSYTDGNYGWLFGSDSNITEYTMDGLGIAFYHLLNRNLYSGGFRGANGGAVPDLPAEETVISGSLDDYLSSIPICPDSTGIWCAALLPSLIDESNWGDRHWAVATEEIPLNGDYDFYLNMYSKLAYSASYTNTGSLNDVISDNDPYGTAGCEVLFRVTANSGDELYQSSSWTSLGNLAISRSGLIQDDNWGLNNISVSAIDMTSNIVSMIPDGQDFSVSAIQFKVNILDPSQDYDSDGNKLYYKIWLLGGVHFFPSQGTTLEPGAEYTYKLRHYTDSHVTSAFSNEVTAIAMMPASPGTIVNVSVSNTNRWNNEVPLSVTIESLSPLDNAPTLKMRHKYTANANIPNANVYNIPFYEPNGPQAWAEVGADKIVVGNDDPDHYFTTYEIDAQAMYSLGFWPNPLAQIYAPWEHGVDDPYFHLLSQSDEFEFTVTAYPIGEEDIPLEYTFTAIYDPEPPALHLEINDVYTRYSGGSDAYQTTHGDGLSDAPSNEDVSYLVKFSPKVYNNISDISGLYVDPSWRVKGSQFRVLVLADNGVTHFRPISIINGDMDPATELIYSPPFGGGDVTVKEYFADNVTDHWGNAVTDYGQDYISALALNTDYEEWKDLNLNSTYEVEFVVPASFVILGLDVIIQVKNELGEVFEYSSLGLQLDGPIESSGYSSPISTGSFTGYKLLDNVLDPYNPLDPPAKGGWANKWSTYTKARISSINNVRTPSGDQIWTGDTVALVGVNFCDTLPDPPGSAPTPFYQYHSEADPSWAVSTEESYNTQSNPIRTITHNPDTQQLYIGGPIKTGPTDSDYAAYAVLNAGAGESMVYYGGGFGGISGGPLGDGFHASHVGDTEFGKRAYMIGFVGGGLYGPAGAMLGFRFSSDGGTQDPYDGSLWIFPPVNGTSMGYFGRTISENNGTIYMGGGASDDNGWFGHLVIADLDDPLYRYATVVVDHSEATFPYPVFDSWISDTGGLMVVAVSDPSPGNGFGCLYYSTDSGATFLPVDAGFTESIKSIEYYNGWLYVAGHFDTHNTEAGNFKYVARYAVSGDTISSTPEMIGVSPFTSDREVCKLHRDENNSYIYFGGKSDLYRWNLQNEEWEPHPVLPTINNTAGTVYDMYTYDHITQGLLLPPDFREVYTELKDSPPLWEHNVGPYMCMMIGDIPEGSPYTSETNFPLLHQAFISSRTAATVGIDGNGIDGFVYRFSGENGQYLTSLYDDQYGSAYEKGSIGLEIDKGYLFAKLLSTYVVRHFNPDSIMDAEDFISDYVYTNDSLATPTQTGKWYADVLPATSYLDGVVDEVSSVGIYSPSGNVIYPQVAPISNVFAFTLNRPPGLTLTEWTDYGGGPITLLCFPMSDVTSSEYNYPASGVNHLGISRGTSMVSNKVAMIGGIKTQENVTPTTDNISISVRKDTPARNTSGMRRVMTNRQKSVYTDTPGFLPTYMLKYLTDDDSVFENSSVVYAAKYKKGGILDVYSDSTSGSYSFGPVVGANESGQKINNHSIIATDPGEEYLLSESGAKSYSYEQFNSIIDPETGLLAHPDSWWGGDIWNTPSGYQISCPKVTHMHMTSETNTYHLFSHIRENTDTGEKILRMRGVQDVGGGHLLPLGPVTTLGFQGSFKTVYYDVLPKPSGDGFIVVTCSAPSPYSESLNSSGGVNTDNWSFYFDDYDFDTDGGDITHNGKHKCSISLDDPSNREDWGVYAFREPTIAWAGKTLVGHKVMAMSFVIDYGLHSDTFADAQVTESRIALALINTNYEDDGQQWPHYLTSSVDPVDGDVLSHIIRVVSPISKPSSWNNTVKRFSGYGRHMSPQIWTNCIFQDGDISDSATSIQVAYIVNGVDFDTSYEEQEHLWDSGKTRQIDSYGSIYYCSRKFVPNFRTTEDRDKLLAPLGEQFRSTTLDAAQFSADQDNWGNVVFAYSTRPASDKVNQYNHDKVYPQYRILKINRVKENLPDKDFTKPLAIDEI